MVSHLNIFVWKLSKIAAHNKVYFFADFALQNMVETTLPDGLETSGRGYIANIGISLGVLSFCVLDDFFRFSKKLCFLLFLVHPTVVSVLLSATVERCFVSRMRDFFYKMVELVGGGSVINGAYPV